MPEIAGIELARLIRHMTDKLVFITAHSKYGYQAFGVHADGYILKPFSLATLAEIAKELNEGRGFIQFQRSYILNRTKIDSIDGNIVTMDDGQKVTIGEHYKKDFSNFVSKFLIKGRRRNN